MRYPNTCASTRRTAARTHIAGHFTSFNISALKLDRMVGILRIGQLEKNVFKRSLYRTDLVHRNACEHQRSIDPRAVGGIGGKSKLSVQLLDAVRSQKPLR